MLVTLVSYSAHTDWGDADELSHGQISIHNATRSISHGAVCSCLHASVLLCSAGTSIPWLSLSQQDVLLPANGSHTISLTYNADDMAAGTYRAQLCLFSDFSYGRQLSCVPTLHLKLDCMQKVDAQAATEQCTFPLDSTHFAIVIIIIVVVVIIIIIIIFFFVVVVVVVIIIILLNNTIGISVQNIVIGQCYHHFWSRLSTCTR